MVALCKLMSEDKIHFYKVPPPFAGAGTSTNENPNPERLAPATCTEAEPFALRVLDDSMEPEFRKGCIIVIDPTGRATDGSFVLAQQQDESYLFRQLQKEADGGWILCALDDQFPTVETAGDLSAIAGVVIQRAGVRRSYHKYYS